MPFNPINYGNILAQTEGIQGARMNNALNARRFDPNSPENQLQRYQLQKVQQDINANNFTFGDPEPIGNTGAFGQRGPQGRFVNNFSPPTQPQGSSAMQEAVSMGLVPGTTPYNEFLVQRSQKPLYSNPDLGYSKEQETLAKNRADRYESVIAEGNDADGKISSLQTLSNIDVNQGFGEEFKSDAARVMGFFGVPQPERLMGANIVGVQSFNAVAEKMILDVMSTQKGPQTKEDQMKIAKTIPSITNEAEANRFIFASLTAIEMRKQERANFYNAYLENSKKEKGEGKGTLRGVAAAWSKYKNSTPLISDSIKNSETGLPMFYYQFREKLKQANPGVTEEQTVAKWRELNG